VVYERIVVPWVDEYETKVDEAVDEAHRGVRRWVFSRFGSFIWLLIGEGGSLADALLKVTMGFLGCDLLQPRKLEEEEVALKPSDSTESLPRHSIKEALSQSSSFSEVDDVSNSSFDPTSAFVRDFVYMLEQGLYVFANVDTTVKSSDSDVDIKIQKNQNSFEGGFKLGIFSYTNEERGAFLISPVAAGSNEMDAASSKPVVLPLDTLKPVLLTGAQGLVFEVDGITDSTEEEKLNVIRVEIVLSDESDRNILFNGLNACLPIILSCEKINDGET